MQHQLFAHEQWLAIAFDMDGCIYNSKYLEHREKMLKRRESKAFSFEEEVNMLIDFNIVMLQGIVNKAKNNYTRLYILSGSRRQDFVTDEMNNAIHNTLSSYIALQILSDFFKEKLPGIHVELITFSMADIEVGSAPDFQHVGTAFQLALDQINHNKNAEHPTWNGLEDNKITICYAHSHLLARMADEMQKRAAIYYCLIDDRIDILETIYIFANKYPEHFPESVRYQFLEYSSEYMDPNFTKLGVSDSAHLKGNGKSNHDFMRCISALQCNHATKEYIADFDRTYRKLDFKDHTEANDLLARYTVNIETTCAIL